MHLIGVVAATPAGVIGNDGDMPWRLSSDLRRFKNATMGGTLLMGRKTFDSIGRPLPGRQTIVVTRNPNWHHEGVDVAHDIDSALAAIDRAQGFVVGGAEIYRLFAPRIDRWMLTRVWSGVAGDTVLDLSLDDFEITAMTPIPASLKDSVPTQFEIWQRHKKLS